MIKGFWHIYMINHWYSIVADQLRILLTSGLYDASYVINIGCIGTESEKNELKKWFVDLYPRLKIKYFGSDPEAYEFPTLQLIEDDNDDYIGYYFHTKAVTKPSESVINHWRAWQNESIRSIMIILSRHGGITWSFGLDPTPTRKFMSFIIPAITQRKDWFHTKDTTTSPILKKTI